MKALIGFKAFYFFGSVSVRFRCVCEMALNGTVSCFCNKPLKVYKIDIPFTQTLTHDQRRGLLIAFPNEK